MLRLPNQWTQTFTTAQLVKYEHRVSAMFVERQVGTRWLEAKGKWERINCLHPTALLNSQLLGSKPLLLVHEL
jgi:hypothetical protein